MQTKHKHICKSLYRMAKLFNKSQMPDDETIETYAMMLEEYEIKQITMAFTTLIKKGITFFPSCAEIIQEINPTVSDESKAQLMADKIFQTALFHGRHQQDRIKADLSDDEMKALQTVGLLTILNSFSKEAPGLKIQLRKTCAAILENKSITHKQNIMKQLSSDSNESLLDFKTALSSLTIGVPDEC